MKNENEMLQKIVAWSKRRGFVFPSSEVYGGMANVYDFGPYGTIMKENIRNLWLKKFVYEREDIYAIDSSVIMNPLVWESSGHTASFADVMVEDKVNHRRHRADHIIEDYFTRKGKEVKVDGKTPEELGAIIVENNIKSPDGNELTEPKRFNQLFQTEVGIISGEKNKAYLRGEIAQGLFMNFKNILDSMHPDLPFGIGQAGKAFRNEITMGKFTFRTLEFDLMEFEYFFDPTKQDWNDLFEYWKSQMKEFASQIGLPEKNLRWRAHEDFERSHYSTRTEDLEYQFPWGFKEMWGLAYRTDYDLRNHMEKSGKDLRYTYADGQKIMPYVIEPTFGLSRLLTVLIFDAYREEEVNGKVRTYLKFDPAVAPVKFAIFPLQKDEKLAELAKELYKKLKKNWYGEYDNAGNIGKMYRRQDEIGTPYCITVDYKSLEEGTLTIRDRDTMEQTTIKIEEIEGWLAAKLQ
jgi:glycyl-tRNA synthetase